MRSSGLFILLIFTFSFFFFLIGGNSVEAAIVCWAKKEKGHCTISSGCFVPDEEGWEKVRYSLCKNAPKCDPIKRVADICILSDEDEGEDGNGEGEPQMCLVGDPMIQAVRFVCLNFLRGLGFTQRQPPNPPFWQLLGFQKNTPLSQERPPGLTRGGAPVPRQMVDAAKACAEILRGLSGSQIQLLGSDGQPTTESRRGRRPIIEGRPKPEGHVKGSRSPGEAFEESLLLTPPAIGLFSGVNGGVRIQTSEEVKSQVKGDKGGGDGGGGGRRKKPDRQIGGIIAESCSPRVTICLSGATHTAFIRRFGLLESVPVRCLSKVSRPGFPNPCLLVDSENSCRTTSRLIIC